MVSQCDPFASHACAAFSAFCIYLFEISISRYNHTQRNLLLVIREVIWLKDHPFHLMKPLKVIISGLIELTLSAQRPIQVGHSSRSMGSAIAVHAPRRRFCYLSIFPSHMQVKY
ncbi:transmembrane protein, putative [Medicago truncatula]|uniref:Transmembrane protein, putative n=1 Tax=Medicago truncatula TaxID=3880 RepID=A0A072TUF5_MEDTR|nr:transmembrane protein, putative [Medicago truncatula]